MPAHIAKLPKVKIIFTCDERPSFLEHHDSTIKPFTFRRVIGSLEEMKDSSTDTAHCEASSKIIDNSVGTRFFSQHCWFNLIINWEFILNKIKSMRDYSNYNFIFIFYKNFVVSSLNVFYFTKILIFDILSFMMVDFLTTIIKYVKMYPL